MDQANWMTYEEVTRELIARYRHDLGLDRIESKQRLQGMTSTRWEIDVVAYAKGSAKLVLFECRRYPDGRITQEEVGAFAYRISDLGASKGYMVTPLGFQAGAQLVADYEKIDLIKLSSDATPDKYVIEFLNRILVGVTDRVIVTDEVFIKVIDRS